MRLILFIVFLVLAIGCGSLPSRPAATATGPIDPTQTKENTIYITNTGKSYHLSTCHHLKRTRQPISLSEAKRRGYAPCRVCQPPR